MSEMPSSTGASDQPPVVVLPRALSLTLSPHLQVFLRNLAGKEDRKVSRTVERLIKSGLKHENIEYHDPSSEGRP